MLTLADGTQIDTRTGRPIRENGVPRGFVEVPTHDEARRAVINVRKRVSDLPEAPEKMNIIAVVAAYYMFGLNEYETAMALGCTEQQVQRIKMTEAFSTLVETMSRNIVEADSDDVRTMIVAHSRDAVRTVVSTMGSENEQVALAAAKDILDRAGHRPADVVEHRHKVEGGLTIEYVRKGEKDDIPTLDLTAEHIGDSDD